MPHHQGPHDRVFYEIHRPREEESVSVTFLHGLGSCGEDWILQLPVVVGDYDVLTVDLPGHGRSSIRPTWPRISCFADDIEDLIRMLGLGPTHVVGLSLGGAVAMQLALDYPEAVRSLTLVNTIAKLHSGSSGFFRKLVRIAFVVLGQMAQVGQWVAGGLFPKPDQELLRQAAAERIAANPRGAYLRAIWAATRFDIRDRLIEINAPTLVVAGEFDQTVSMDAKKELAGNISGAHLVVIPDSGHATPLDAVEEFNRTLLDFLSKVDGG